MSRLQPDLFTALTPPCIECCNLGDAIESGLRYCWGTMALRGPDERAEGCRRRDRPAARWTPAATTRADALRDLLNHPRHNIDAKGRAWLAAELRRETKAGKASGDASAAATASPADRMD